MRRIYSRLLKCVDIRGSGHSITQVTIGMCIRLSVALIVLALYHYPYFEYLGLQPTPFFELPSYSFLVWFALATLISTGKVPKFPPEWIRPAIVISLTYIGVRLILEFNGYYTGAPRFGGDQGSYYNMVDRITGGTLDSNSFFYGLGYPLLGVIAQLFYPDDAFYLINIGSYVLVAFFAYRVISHLMGSKPAALVAALYLGLNVYTYRYIVVPWTSTISIVCYFYAVDFVIRRKWRYWNLILLGVLTGLIFATRYVDVLLIAPIWIYLLWVACKRRRRHLPKVLVGGLFGGLIIMGVFYAHYHYFGGILETPYRNHLRPDGGTDQSLGTYFSQFGYPMLVHLYGSLVDTKLAWDYDRYTNRLDPVFAMNIIFMFCVPGLYLLYKRLKKYRAEFITLLSGILLFCLIYSMHPGTYPGTLRFGSAHYYKPLIPLFYIGGTYLFFSLFRGTIRIRNFIGLVSANLIAGIAISVLMGWQTPVKAVLTGVKTTVSPTDPIDLFFEIQGRKGNKISRFTSGVFQPYANLIGKTKEGKVLRHYMKLEADYSDGVTWHGRWVPEGNEGVESWKVYTYTLNPQTIKVSRE